jgi:hypothetical protein
MPVRQSPLVRKTALGSQPYLVSLLLTSQPLLVSLQSLSSQLVGASQFMSLVIFVVPFGRQMPVSQSPLVRGTVLVSQLTSQPMPVRLSLSSQSPMASVHVSHLVLVSQQILAYLDPLVGLLQASHLMLVSQ